MGTCDGTSLVVFLVGLAAGTFCTIASKLLFQMHAPGLDGRVHAFTPPLFQTFVMFLGMSFALPAHYLGEWYRARQAVHSECCGGASPATPDEPPRRRPSALETYLVLAVPSVFDLIATCLMVLGLLHTAASVWMLLRGGGIVFVALMKHFVLRDSLTPYAERPWHFLVFPRVPSP